MSCHKKNCKRTVTLKHVWEAPCLLFSLLLGKHNLCFTPFVAKMQVLQPLGRK